MAGAAAGDAVIGLAEAEGQVGDAEQRVGDVQHVGQRRGPAHGVHAHAVAVDGGGFRALAAGRARHAGGEALVVGRSARFVELGQHGAHVRGALLVVRQQVDQVAHGVGEHVEGDALQAAGRGDAGHQVGQRRALVRRVEGGHRGHQVGAGVHHIAGGEATLAVTDQVELLHRAAGRGADLLQLRDQRLATLGRAVEGVDLRYMDLGPLALQGAGDLVPVIDAGDGVEGEDAGDEDDGVLGLRLGVGQGREGRAQTEGGQCRDEQLLHEVYLCVRFLLL